MIAYFTVIDSGNNLTTYSYMLIIILKKIKRK